MRTINKLLAAALLLVPVTSFAEGLSYNYVEGGYVKVDLDDADVDADGFRARVSGLVSESIYLFASYLSVKSDKFTVATFTSATSEVEQITAGFGLRAALGPSTDFFGEVAYVYVEGEDKNAGPIFSGKEDDNGFGLSAGLRHLFSSQFELAGAVNYVDVFGDDATSYTASALFHLTPAFSLGGGYTFGDDADGWTAGVRFNF